MYLLLLVSLLLMKTALCTYCGNALHIVDISDSFKDQALQCKSGTGVNHTICSTLKSAFKSWIRNRTCFRIFNDQVIDTSITISGVHHFYIVKDANLPQLDIFCKKRESGFAITNSSNIFISGLTFNKCGIKQNSTSYATCKSHQNCTPPISTAFYFKNAKNINLSQMRIVQSFGYGAVMYDVTGLIFFETVVISGGQKVLYDETKPGYSSGGGLYIEYTVNASLADSSNAVIRLDNCLFFCNKADTISAKPIAEGLAEGHIPFARGAGLAMFFMGRIGSKNNNIIISNSQFTGNVAAWGGAFYLRFRNRAANNNVHLYNVSFNLNNATDAGGGMFVTSTQDSTIAYNNTITIRNNTFLRNIAQVGGAFSQLRIDVKFRKEEKTVFQNCNFTRNKAYLGAAIQLKHVLVHFEFVIITDSNIHVAEAANYMHGAVYAFESTLNFFQKNFVRDNLATAFILDCSDVYVYNHLEFYNNTGNDGGALSLYGHSKIYLCNSTDLVFFSNTALHNGGAINVNIPGPAAILQDSSTVRIYECFLLFYGQTKLESPYTFQGRVTFSHNLAKSGSGDSIFSTTLKNCRSTINEKMTKVVFDWTNFALPANSIATRAINIDLSRGDWQVWPGDLFSPSIVLKDEYGNDAKETVDVSIFPDSCIRIETNKRFVVTDNKITLKFLSCRKEYLDGNSIDIQVTVVGMKSVSQTLTGIKLKPCYFGYSLQDTQCQCNIKKNQAKGIAFCYNRRTYLFKGRWADPKKGVSKDQESTQVCPQGYCKECDKNETFTNYACLYQPDKNNQCKAGRYQNSTLCSRCEPNLSVTIGGETCLNCTGHKRFFFLWIIPLIILVVSLLILYVKWLNVDIYSNYLNGCLYYYQVITLLKTSSLQLKDPIRSFIGILNIESPGSVFPGVCFFDGFNDLQKNAFNYIFPVWMIAVLVIIAKYAKNHPDSYFSRQNCFRAFTIISVTAYSDFTRITFKLLESVKVGDDVRVQVYANVKWNEEEHKGYVAFGFIAIIVIVIGFPILLMFSTWLIGLHCRYVVNPIVRWKPIIDCFKMCFRHKHTWFASYYFLCRALILGIGTFMQKDPLQNVVMAIMCFLIFVFFVMHQPYKDKWMNMYDTMILTNLTAVTILALGMRSSRSDTQRNYCGVITKVLIYIPIVIVLGRLVYVYGPKFYNFCKDVYVRIKHGKKNVAIPKRSLQKENELEEEAFM